MNRANTTPVILRIAIAIRTALAASTVTESFSVSIPGKETFGNYATVEEAEAAIRFLPFCDRQNAMIVNQDGYCIEC